jgi:hypothetical protein
MSDLRKYILMLAMLGIVLILQYSSFLVGMDMMPGFQQSPPEDTTGSVVIVSEPAGALVFFDGVDTGETTNFTRMDVMPGNHTVKVTLKGYYPKSEQFEVYSGKMSFVRLILVPINMTPEMPEPVHMDPQYQPPFGGDDQPDDSPIVSIVYPAPVPVPAPEFPSPGVPVVMVVVCIGVVMMFGRYKD